MLNHLDPELRAIVSKDKALLREISSAVHSPKNSLIREEARLEKARKSKITLTDVNRALRLYAAGKAGSTAGDAKKAHKVFASWMSKKFKIADRVNVAFRHLFSQSTARAHELVMLYRSDLMKRKSPRTGDFYSRATINLNISMVTGLTETAYTLGVSLFILRVKSLPYDHQEHEQYFPETKDIKKIVSYLSGIKDESFENYRDYIIFLISWTLALRVKELSTLIFEVADLRLNKLGVLSKKRGKKRIRMDIPENLTSEIMQYHQHRKKYRGPLFYENKYNLSAYSGVKQKYLSTYQINQIIKLRAVEAGVFDCIKNPMTVHGIRRGAISEVSVKAQEKGCRLEDVLDFSRHKDTSKIPEKVGKNSGEIFRVCPGCIVRSERGG